MNPSFKTRVTIVSRHLLNRGGLEKWAYQIAQAFVDQKAEVHVLTSDPIPHSFGDPSLQFHTISLTKRLNARKIKEFDALCQKWHQQPENGSDIIFGMDRTRYQTHLRAGNGVHAAYLNYRQMIEGYPRYKKYLNPLNRTLLKIEKEAFEDSNLKIIFTNSHMVKNEILHYYNVSSSRIKVIHNGVNWKERETDFSNWVASKERICHTLQLDPSLFHFVFIGNGYRRKGLHLLMEALATLSLKQFHLSVIGKEKRLTSFIKQAAHLKLQSNVRFFGFQQDLTPFFQIGDCLVVPSLYDPFANVTIEALAMGLFVVSSKTNGGHEVLQKETGTVIENLSDVESLATALQRAIKRPKTWDRSNQIRKSVEDYEMSRQLASYTRHSIERCLSPIS